MNAQHLLELINTLLDFRKLDVGAETLHCKQGDIIHFVKELVLLSMITQLVVTCVFLFLAE